MRLRCHLPLYRTERRTVAEMARVSGVPRPYLTDIERGIRLPTDEQAEQIASAYGVTLEEMYDWRAPQLLAVELDPTDPA